MDARLYIVAAIIVVTGLLGGLAAYLMEPVPEGPKPESMRRVLMRSLLLGVLAALCVPLFLSLVRSGLMGNIFTPAAGQSSPPAFEDYLIFTGLCVIAAISSRRFIDSISQQLIERVGKAEKTAAGAKKVAQQAKEEAGLGEAADDPNAPRPPEAESVTAAETAESPSNIFITPDERKVLKAMMNRTYRTRTGIAEDSGISKMRISELLESLADRKLALPTTSPRTGGARWIITKRGIAAANGPS